MWQVAASYGIGIWIVLQVAETLSSLIGLPLWFGRLLIVVLLTGFLVLVAVSFVRGRAASTEGRRVLSMLTWKNALGVGAAATVLAGLVAGGYLAMRQSGLGPVGTLQAKGVFEEQERVILADFEGDDLGLAETVTTLLRIDLAQSRAFTVLEPVQLRPVLNRMRRDPTEPVTYDVALEAARRDGVKAVVAGELLAAGGATVVSARIVAVSSGDVLVAVRETADEPSDIPETVDVLSAQLRERVGESLRAIQGDPPLEDVTTPSLQALERYAQAQRANDLGDMERSISLLEEALAADSTFAMAHRKLGIVLNNQGLQLERAREEFTRAYELRDRLTDRERWLAEAAYLSWVEGEQDAAADRYETVLEAYPTDAVALNNLALYHRSAGRDTDALDLYMSSIAHGGAPATTFAGAIPILFSLGQREGALRVLADFEATYPGNPSVAQQRFAIATATFDYEGAREALGEILDASTDPRFEVDVHVSLGFVRLIQGRVQEAFEELRAAFGIMEELNVDLAGLSQGAAEGLVQGTLHLYYLDDPAGAIRAMDETRERFGVGDDPPEQREDLAYASLYISAGAPERGRALIDAYASSVDEAERERSREWTGASGQLAIAEGRGSAGIALLHQAQEMASAGCGICGWAELGSGFDATAQPDSAIHYFERYVQTPDLGRLNNGDNVNFWAAVPRLGELHAEHGDPARARELFELFLAVTSGADAAYQGKRARIQRALDDLPG